MKSLFGGAFAVLVFVVLASSNSFGQTFAPTPHSAATQPAATQTAQLQELTKKIDEQNAKIDMLSQQILKLQLQLSNQRPGVMIGEGAWMGAGAKILDGVTVGDYAVVGAGAVVREDVPPRAVAVGIPARVVSTRNS